MLLKLHDSVVVSLTLYHVGRLMSGSSRLVVYSFITALAMACFLHGRGVGHSGYLWEEPTNLVFWQ